MLKDELRAHLTDKILPFWEAMADTEQGGFYGYMGQDLQVQKDADKGCILNSRILWTFATAARILADDTARAMADRAFRFMQRFVDPEHGGVWWSVTCDGRPADTTKHTYCQAFAIYGLAAYYRLTGSKEALAQAMSLFHTIEEKCTVWNGYGEAYKADFSPESNEKLSENGVMASRTMNTLLHVLEAYAELYRAKPDEAVREASVRCLDRFLNVMYDPDKRRLGVFYDAEYNELLDMQSFGHDVEAGWLLWDAAITVLPACELPPYRDMCVDLVRSVTERAWTENGLKGERVNGVDDEIRIWWAQAECILGFANTWALTGERVWADRCVSQWEIVQRLIVDPREGGEWFWSYEKDGSHSEHGIVEQWKCPYHNGRLCLRMIEQPGLPV